METEHFRGIPLALICAFGILLVWYPLARIAHDRQSNGIGIISIVLFLAAVFVPEYILLTLNGF